ncbi:Complement factor H-related protein 2 [Lemmus lemmus]
MFSIFLFLLQVQPCDFPQIKNGELYRVERTKYYFPVETGRSFYYRCNQEFVTPTRTYWDSIRCTAQGWEPAVPCRSKSISVLNQGSRDTAESRSYEHGTKLSYACDDGFRMAEEHGVTCHMGKWSTPPRCVGENSIGKCGPPPPIKNGDITSFRLQVYAPSSSVEYQCQSVYKLQGNKKITCRNGEWSEPPKCLNACVVSEEIMERHNMTLRWKEKQKLYVSSSDYVEFTCKFGYEMATTSPPLRAMCIDGYINYPSCTKKWIFSIG